MGLRGPTTARSARGTGAAPLHAEDRALVERTLLGDERAFAELVERYSSPLYRFSLARAGGDRELARDTVQTAMTKAIAKLDGYRGESSLFTWLCACCRNEILMHRRRLASAPIRVELDDATQPAVGSPSGHDADPQARLLLDESRRLVHTTLDLLAPRYAQALEWKYVDRIPVNEIASRLGLRPKAAESLLTRARNAFRAAYEGLLADASGEAGDPRREPPREDE
jgi:RNA polymerase sigma-70 factor (ECF subfamily)